MPTTDEMNGAPATGSEQHWYGPELDGSPRPVDRQFLELEREGIACLYRIFNDLVAQVYRHSRHKDMLKIVDRNGRNNGGWIPMLREHWDTERAWAANNGRRIRIKSGYGELYGRLKNEAKSDNETITAEQIGHQWAEVFTEEVRHLLGVEPNDETSAAVTRLHTNVKGYAFGTKDGKGVLERMRAEATGAEALAAFGRIRDHLNALLDELTGEHATPEQMEAGYRITWQGTKGELAGLIMELHERGWIRRDGSWATLAAKVQAVFQDAQGQTFDLPTLRQYVKPSGNFNLREGVKFDVSKCPE